MASKQAYWGLLRRRSCLIPTWRALLLVLLSSAIFWGSVFTNIHPFLAITDRVPAKILVVEGWLPDYALAQAKLEFDRGGYQKIYVTGGPLEIGGHLSEYKTYAEIAAATLIQMGLSKNTVEAIPAPNVLRDRTNASAKALKALLIQRAAINPNINLVSIGVHAKRSHLLFQNVFGDFAEVGVIAIENQEYDPHRWWLSSNGVRTIINESVAYCYALIVFPFL